MEIFVSRVDVAPHKPIFNQNEAHCTKDALKTPYIWKMYISKSYKMNHMLQNPQTE